ncbi:hypothetical protein GCM10027318_34080 [Massilia agilis]
MCANPHCDLCRPRARDASSPNVQSAPSNGPVIDPHQVAELFAKLRPYGQAVVWASLTSAARLDGVKP